MTYLGLLEVLEAAARTVDPTATYYRGRESDVSLISHAANTTIIYVLDTMRIEPDENNMFERWNIRIGFFKQDSTSSESMEANKQQSGEDSREVIFSDMHVLARQYYDALFNEETIQLVGSPSYTQLTRQLQGTYSGWGLDVAVLLEVGCEQTFIADATYRNSDDTFQVEIERGEIYTAPDITVTDSDGTEVQHPANKDFVCTPSASPATAVLKNTEDDFISSTQIDPGTTEYITAPDASAVLKNSANTTISTTSIPSNTSSNITAPDATAVIKNSLGTTLDTEAIPSNVSEDIILPDVNNVDSDGSVDPTPAGVAYTCTPQVKTLELFFAFTSGTDTSALATNGITTWTLTSLAQDGASGTITVSVNGGAYAAFSNPTSITNGQTLQVKRTSTGSAGSVTITGTYA